VKLLLEPGAGTLGAGGIVLRGVVVAAYLHHVCSCPACSYRDRDGLQSSHIIRVANRVFTRGTSIVQVPRVMDGNHASSSAPGAGSNGALVLVKGSNGRDRGVLVAMSVTDRLASHVITAVEGITLETVMYMINVHVPV